MILKKYHGYLTGLFLRNILIILTVFICLSFFLNIFEEIKFFENKDNNLYYPIILTILNIPSILFEILPFIFLLGVMFFFISLFERDEIELLRCHGINNFKITTIIATLATITTMTTTPTIAITTIMTIITAPTTMARSPMPQKR